MFVKFIDESSIQVLPQNGEMMIPHVDKDDNVTYNREGVSNMALYCAENPDIANYNGIYEFVEGETPEGESIPYYEIEDNKVVQKWRLTEDGEG